MQPEVTVMEFTNKEVSAILDPIDPLGLHPPTADEIDAAIVFYQNAESCWNAAKATMDGHKKHLIELTDKYGHRPAHAEQSIRLAGRRHTVTITRGTTVTVNESAVADLEAYLGDLLVGADRMIDRLFAKTVKHTLVEGARDLFKRLDLPRRTEEKALSLFGRCIDLKTKGPSVKVELVQPEKPAKKPRGGKKAA